MREKLHQAVRDVATELLSPGETVVATARGTVAKMRVGTNLAAAAAAAALGSGVTVVSVPKTFFFLLTSHRLLVLDPSAIFGRPTSRVVGWFSREGLYGYDLRSSLRTSFALARAGQAVGTRLSFALVDRADALRFSAALGMAA